MSRTRPSAPSLYQRPHSCSQGLHAYLDRIHKVYSLLRETDVPLTLKPLKFCLHGGCLLGYDKTTDARVADAAYRRNYAQKSTTNRKSQKLKM